MGTTCAQQQQRGRQGGRRGGGRAGDEQHRDCAAHVAHQDHHASTIVGLSQLGRLQSTSAKAACTTQLGAAPATADFF